MKKTKRLLVVISMVFFIVPLTTSFAQPQKGKIYIVGVGPAGPELCTLKAIKVIQEADIIYVPTYIKNLFSDYLVGKDVRSDWADYLLRPRDKPYTALRGQDLIDYVAELKIS